MYTLNLLKYFIYNKFYILNSTCNKMYVLNLMKYRYKIYIQFNEIQIYIYILYII